MTSKAALKRWSGLAEKYRGTTDWCHFYHRLFDGVDFTGNAILDVGGGVGLAATYALMHGASRATLLEPEDAGSRGSVLDKARNLRADLELEDRLTLLPDTFQDFDGEGAPFDVAILEASVNHLDEEAVETLHQGGESLHRYREISDKLASLLSPGAILVVSDCARRNFFGDLGLRNPLVPTISWEKHQQPAVWIQLFHESGFADPKVRWGIHSTLGPVGRALLGNQIAFYFLSSYFILTMRHPGQSNR